MTLEEDIIRFLQEDIDNARKSLLLKSTTSNLSNALLEVRASTTSKSSENSIVLLAKFDKLCQALIIQQTIQISSSTSIMLLLQECISDLRVIFQIVSSLIFVNPTAANSTP